MRVKIGILGILMLAIIAAPHLLYAGEASEIVVTGLGTASIMPDKATVHFSIDTFKKTAEEAAEENARNYELLISAMGEIGYERNKIYTTSYRVDQRFDRKKRKKIIGYSANHYLYVSTKEIGRINEIVDVVLRSGVTRIREVKYASTRADSVRRVALSAAVRNARADAEAMALAAEGELDSLIELTTHYPDNPTFKRDRSEALAFKAGIVRGMSITPAIIIKKVTVLGRWIFIGPQNVGDSTE